MANLEKKHITVAVRWQFDVGVGETVNVQVPVIVNNKAVAQDVEFKISEVKVGKKRKLELSMADLANESKAKK